MRALHRGEEGGKDKAPVRGEPRQEREVQEGRENAGAENGRGGGLASFRGTEAREETIATAAVAAAAEQEEEEEEEEEGEEGEFPNANWLILLLYDPYLAYVH